LNPCTQNDECSAVTDNNNSLIGVVCRGSEIQCEDDGDICTEAFCNQENGECEQRVVSCPSSLPVLPPEVIDSPPDNDDGGNGENPSSTPSPTPRLLAPVEAITLPPRPPLPNAIAFAGSSTPSSTPQATRVREEEKETNNNVFYNNANYGISAFAMALMAGCGCIGVCVALITAHREKDRKDRLLEVLDDGVALNEGSAFVESEL